MQTISVEKIKNIENLIDKLISQSSSVSISGIEGYTKDQIDELVGKVSVFETENNIVELGLSRILSSFSAEKKTFGTDHKKLIEMGKEWDSYLNALKRTLACLSK